MHYTISSIKLPAYFLLLKEIISTIPIIISEKATTGVFINILGLKETLFERVETLILSNFKVMNVNSVESEPCSKRKNTNFM